MEEQNSAKWIGDRTYNAMSDVYYLPADDEEWTRLNKQHTAISIGMGALYPVPSVVRSILAPKEGEVKRILDLGCGTGIWATEMAKEFPHCQILGIDLAPVPIDRISVPDNCRFELGDIAKGLGHLKGQYDFINARLIGSGLKNFRQTLQDAAECLKPGGIVVWSDADYDMYMEEQRVYMAFATDEDTSGSWFQRIIYEMRRGAVNSGKSDLYGMSEALDAGLWKEPLMDPVTCRTASLYLPLGPWPADIKNSAQAQVVRHVGSLMRQDMMSAHRAGHAVVKRSGYSQETLTKWSEKADEEMMDGNKRIWLRIRIAWGQRRNEEGPLAPPIPSIINEDSPVESAYPYYYIYTTEEESLRETVLRNRGKDLPEPPLPTARA
ncbi:hypothetical protein M408DRAFT_334364 [Serendipita vermifera MAFF 305830]|uniref:Methyltransferase domain-containing protein n=1 Tax=Serendipita vermifera MAFF 305830 TaxID=933852 RepID=A0A0C2VZ03_SERVB|nr:hypothetical protein M408DRAFT_334364 [Serendipita vermifera MAFF 305830]